MRFRIVIGITFIALIIWVAFDESPFERKARKIEAALSTGAIGFKDNGGKLINRTRTKALVKDLLNAANFTGQYAINAPPQSDRLDIYFTTPSAYDVTNVDTGNAGYDAVLDAIYIDQSFVDHNIYLSLCRGSRLGVLGCREYYPSLDVMFAFVFLHELGHRQKHGVGSGWLAFRHSTKEMRRLESEADHFALDNLKAAYNIGVAVIDENESDNNLDDTLGLGFPGQYRPSPSERVWIDLIGSIAVSTMLNAFLTGPYSPFFEDKSHPNFITRSIGLINAVLNDEALSEPLSDHFRFFQALLKRQTTVPTSLVAEIVSPEPIVDIGFTDTHAVMMTDAGRKHIQIPFNNLKKSNSSDDTKCSGLMEVDTLKRDNAIYRKRCL